MKILLFIGPYDKIFPQVKPEFEKYGWRWITNINDPELQESIMCRTPVVLACTSCTREQRAATYKHLKTISGLTLSSDIIGILFHPTYGLGNVHWKKFSGSTSDIELPLKGDPDIHMDIFRVVDATDSGCEFQLNVDLLRRIAIDQIQPMSSTAITYPTIKRSMSQSKKVAINDTHQLSVLTYNILFKSRTINERLPILLDTMLRYTPDIICLQEVLNRADVMNQITDELKSAGYTGQFDTNDKATFRLATFVRDRLQPSTLQLVQNIPENYGSHARCAALLTAYILPGIDKPLIVCNVHLPYGFQTTEVTARTDITRKILEYLRKIPNQAQIVCGDFNSTYHSISMQPLHTFKHLHNIYYDVTSQPSSITVDPGHAHLHGMAVDYIYATPLFSAKAILKLPPSLTHTPIPIPGIAGSDHLHLYTEMTYL
jgi:endonuclease/exonuclease/phosphatase family metal-dependent hydrolase